MQRTLNFISIIAAALFLLATLSCSSTKEVKQGYAINRQNNLKVLLSKLAVDQFFHQVQPAQKEIEKLYGLAVKLQKQHRHYPAIDAFKEILRQEPKNIEALNGIAVSSDLIGEHTAAAAYYKRALKVNPKLDHIWNNLGYCYFLQNKQDLSIDAYQKAIAINPDLQKYRNNLVRVSAKQNQFSGSQDQIKSGQNKKTPPKVPAKITQMKELESRVSKSVINDRLSKIDMVPIEIVTPKKTAVERGKIMQQIDPIDLEPVQLGALKPFPLAPSFKDIEPNDLGLDQAPLPSDLRVNPVVHKNKKYVDQELKLGNRLHTDKISFKSLPRVNPVQKIAEIARPKISTKAKEPVEMDTALTISKVIKPISSYQVSLTKVSSDRLVIIPATVENQIGYLKHFRMNTRLKKKRAEISSDRLVITPALVEKQRGPLKHLQVNARLKTKRAAKKNGLKRRTMVVKQTSGIQIYGLEVSNGNGIYHIARNVSTYLKNKGAQVSRITNATHFQYPRTKLYYLKGLLEKARELAKIIPGRPDVVEVPAFDHDHVRIKLLLGKDVSSAGMLL